MMILAGRETPHLRVEVVDIVVHSKSSVGVLRIQLFINFVRILSHLPVPRPLPKSDGYTRLGCS